MTKLSPIGIFDSGLGGISIWKGIREELPGESLIYFGDGLRCPYGNRTENEVRSFTIEAVERLLARDCKMIVVACNTATAMAIDDLRERFREIPIVGLEPAVKPAALSTSTGVIGVLATARSFDGKLYRHTSSLFQDSVKILEAVGEGWVELVENDMEDTAEAQNAVSRVIEPMLKQGADRLVLGCTHYPFLKKTIGRVIGSRNVSVVDSTRAVSHRVRELLKNAGMLNDSPAKAEYIFQSLLGEEYEKKLMRKAGVI